nr:retrotransposon protein, putative, Ty1-copia subclass [Tanacetum cinerariifolium]
DLEIIQEEDTHPSLDTSLNHEEDDLDIDEPQSDIVPIRRSTRTRHAPDRIIPMLQSVKTYLEKFAMKDLGEAAYILGIKIYRDRSKRLIGLCQSAYIEKILKRYCIENFKRGSIPMQEELKLSKSQGTSTPAEMKRMQNVPYASAVGSIMYAVRYTRPDVAFAQNIKSDFNRIQVIFTGPLLKTF